MPPPTRGLRSPEHAPSAWKTRFGRKQSDSDGHPKRASHSPQAAPSIADQLLSALDARGKRHAPEDELSRQCADELLGRRNAFVPDIRMQEQAQHSPHDSDDGVHSAAHEIIMNRLQIDRCADTIRSQKDKSTSAAAYASRSEAKRSRGSVGATTRAKRSTPADTKASPRAPEAAERPESKIPHSLFVLEDDLLSSDAKVSGTRRSRRISSSSTVRARGPGISTKRSTTNAPLTEDGDQFGDPRAPSKRTSAAAPASMDPIRSMEQRQQRIREMKAARAVAAVSNQPQQELEEEEEEEEEEAGRSPGDAKPPRPTRGSSNNNQESSSATGDGRAKLAAASAPAIMAARREERLLHERIQRLESENQQAAQFEDRARDQRQQRQTKASAFSLWTKQVDLRRHQEARARQVFAWRLLLRAWGNWKQWSRATVTQRVEQETRARLVREKLVLAQADRFWREKQLPRWFFRWCASVRAAKDARELEAAQQRRKEQAQRLMERMLRQQAASEEEKEKRASNRHHDERCKSSTAAPELSMMDARVADAPDAKPAARSRHQHESNFATCASQRVSKMMPGHTTEPDSEELAPSASQRSSAEPHENLPPAPPKVAAAVSKTSKSSPPPAVDPLYASMQERAAERKQRRDLLKQRYEVLEQEKRDIAALQMAEVEAQLAQQKLDERMRVRERKRQEALAAQEKALRLEHFEAQRRAARRHNHLRLLLYYGFLPLRRHWESSQRVAVNVSVWHRLRVLHNSWLNWLQFMRERRVKRKQVEQRQLAFAARHHARSLQRWSFAALRSLLLHTQRVTLAARRHAQRQLQHRLWTRWQRFVAHRHLQEQERVRHAAGQLSARRLQRAWIQWRAAAAELREQRERQQEKDRLWRKVRGWLNE